MGNIALLDQVTIDKIAAGEVVERPGSVVKELAENAIDAGSTAVTVEIRDGGISFIRISDNGSGIDPLDVKKAFLRHSTSKIRSVDDLMTIHSLGFRGEALSSISAVSMVEVLTKKRECVCGVRYCIEGGAEKLFEEAASPDGTTFFVRNLFYNTPARKKFLKSPATEAGYIHDLMIRLALSHPEISFKFINNGQTKLHSSGNHQLRDVIYQVYGRDAAKSLNEITHEKNGIKINGYIGKPGLFRGNRNYETYFVNGRYVKSNLIAKAIEDAYKGYLMQHQYPFCVLSIEIDGRELDVNVHPTKMELRFSNQKAVYDFVYESVRKGLENREYIPELQINIPEKDDLKPKEPINASGMIKDKQPLPKEQPDFTDRNAPKEKNLEYFLEQMRQRVKADYASREKKSPYEAKYERKAVPPAAKLPAAGSPAKLSEEQGVYNSVPEQMKLFETTDDGKKLLDEKSIPNHQIIGQLFETYWLVEFDEKLFIIDQHAAHEKVLYEQILNNLSTHEFTSQMLSPPLVLSLSMQEEELLNKYHEEFTKLGYEIEHFGGTEYQICAVPANLYNINSQELFVEILDNLSELSGKTSPQLILEKIASMSCKAAVKGNQKLSRVEIEALIRRLLSLENPYQCPHGRPTIISMSKYEIEKKFKRIV